MQNPPVEKSNLITVLEKLPKIDLHRHLEGSLRLSTLADIARQNGENMVAYSMEELRPLVQVVDDTPDFQGFLAKFAVLRKFYSSQTAISRIAYEAVADAATDNICYLELRFNPVALAHLQGFSFEEVTDWVINAVNKAQHEKQIKVRLIVQLGRHEPEHARRLVALAVDRMQDGVVAIDLAGDEEQYSAKRFIEVMHWAKAQGLHITAHAGECERCPATNVLEAIDVIGAERIGHGVQAVGNSNIMQMLRSKQITLEMCPTSNLQTGAISGLSGHPLRTFHQCGVPVTINTDDPSISNITLSDEYLVAHEGIGISMATLKEMILNAAKAAFLPDAERDQLISWFTQALDESQSIDHRPN